MSIFNFNLFSSDGSRHNPAEINLNKVLLYYSKTPRMSMYPEFYLWIYTDGKVIYKRTNENREIRGILSQEEIDDFEILLKKDLDCFRHARRVRSFPITILKSDENEFEYHSLTISGSLKTIDNKVKYLLKKLQTLSSENTTVEEF